MLFRSKSNCLSAEARIWRHGSGLLFRRLDLPNAAIYIYSTRNVWSGRRLATFLLHKSWFCISLHFVHNLIGSGLIWWEMLTPSFTWYSLRRKTYAWNFSFEVFFFYGGNFILIDSFKTKFGFIIFHCHHHHYYHCYYVILVIFIIVIVILMIIVVDS